jgi:hypothetical protein
MDEQERQELIAAFRKIRENWTEADEEEARRINASLPRWEDTEYHAIVIPKLHHDSAPETPPADTP